jgi:putative transposase
LLGLKIAVVGRILVLKRSMGRHDISDKDWEAIKDLLPGSQPHSRGPVTDNRLFINAVLYVAATGIPWRDLPPRYGKWNTVYVRFRRWSVREVWKNVLKELGKQRREEIQTLMIDSTVVRVHHRGAGALKKAAGKSPRP